MYQSRLWIGLVGVAILAACSSESGDSTTRGNASGVMTSDPETAATMDPMRQARLGPVSYRFDPEILARAEVQIPIPPAYEDTAFAIKLIPRRLLDNPAAPLCTYSGEEEQRECSAEEETGVAIAILERPLADYRVGFAGMGGELSPIEIDGHDGFAYSDSEHEGDVQYQFVPLGERSLMVARSFDANDAQATTAIRAVIRSIDL